MTPLNCLFIHTRSCTSCMCGGAVSDYDDYMISYYFMHSVMKHGLSMLHLVQIWDIIETMG